MEMILIVCSLIVEINKIRENNNHNKNIIFQKNQIHLKMNQFISLR
jgi:hypothetical protein